MNSGNENVGNGLRCEPGESFLNVPKQCCGGSSITRRTFIRRSGGATVAALVAIHCAEIARASEIFADGESYFCCPQGTFSQEGTTAVSIPDFKDKLRVLIAQQLASDVTAPANWTFDGPPVITIGNLEYENDPMTVNFSASGEFTGVSEGGKGEVCTVDSEITEVSGDTDLENPVSFNAEFPIKKTGTVVTDKITIVGQLDGSVSADLADGDDVVSAESYPCQAVGELTTSRNCSAETTISWAVELKLTVDSGDPQPWSWVRNAGNPDEERHSGTWDVGGSTDKNVNVTSPSYGVTDSCGPA